MIGENFLDPDARLGWTDPQHASRFQFTDFPTRQPLTVSPDYEGVPLSRDDAVDDLYETAAPFPRIPDLPPGETVYDQPGYVNGPPGTA